MRVRMRTIAAGPGLNASPGQVVDVDDERGRQLASGGYAEVIREEAVAEARTEKAVDPKAGKEKAVNPRAGKEKAVDPKAGK